MDEFGVFIFGALIALFIIFYALGRYYPGSGAEQVHWRPTRSPELEAQLELEDLDQMLEAQNERRRRSGRPELTEAAIQAEVDSERRAMEQRGELYRETGEETTPPRQPEA
jgi:hypothetical protein